MLSPFKFALPVLSLAIGATLAHAESVLPTFVASAEPDARAATLALEGGPVRADAPRIGFRADKDALRAIVTRRAATNVFDRNTVYYRETRGFRAPEIVVTVASETGDAVEHVFPLGEDASLDTTIELADFLKGVDVHVRGQQDIYKCFDASTCVFESTFEATIYSFDDDSVAVQDYEPIVSCGNGEAVVERRLATPGTQRVKIRNDDLRRHLGLDTVVTGAGDPATDGASFRGFAAELSFYGSYGYGRGAAYRTAHVFRDHGGLKLKVDTAPHYFCHYTRTISYPDYLTQAVRIGQPCPYSGYDRWYVTGSSGGADQAYARDWFVQRCTDL